MWDLQVFVFLTENANHKPISYFTVAMCIFLYSLCTLYLTQANTASYTFCSVLLSQCLTTNKPSSSGAFGPLAYPSIPAHKANGGIDPGHVPVYHRANTERPSFKLTFTHTAYSESTSSSSVGKSCSSQKKPTQAQGEHAVFQFLIQLAEVSTAWIWTQQSFSNPVNINMLSLAASKIYATWL